MIKHMTKISPSMGLKLVSSRILIKKTLPYYPTPHARAELVELATQSHSENKLLYTTYMKKKSADVSWRGDGDDCGDEEADRTRVRTNAQIHDTS